MPNARRTKADLIAELDAVRESEAMYRSLAEHASDMISELDEQGRLLFTTANCQAILGISPAELIGRSMLDGMQFDRIHPDDRDAALDAYQRGIGGDEEIGAEYRFRHADDSWRRLHGKATTYRNAAGELRFVVITRDVTAKWENEQALRRSEERFRVLAETTHDLVVELDEAGRVVYLSGNSAELIGMEPEEIIGTNPFHLVHPDDIDRAVGRFADRMEPDQPQDTPPFRVRHRDGTWRVFEGGGFNYRTPEGEMHMVGVIQDITASCHAEEERRKLEARMQQAQKLEGLGVMAGGVAHDFNNLLTPILGDASLALMDLPDSSPVRVRLEKIQAAARRAAELTGQMLAYAGEETLQPERVDLSQLVGEMKRLLESAVSRKSRLRYELSGSLPAVDADASQLSQVAMNLVHNASEALGDGEGEIEVRTGSSRVELSELAGCVLGSDLAAGTYVHLEVADDGRGMDETTRSRIFDPFFSTKFIGRGLGLAAVLGIVRAHGGCISIDSAPGKGTRFRVLLPAASDPARRPGPPRGRAQAPLSGTVLVADDDPGVRELTEETLGRAGLQVLSAIDGHQAVELFREHRDEIRAVLLDRSMPSRSGEEAFDAIRAIRPDVPIILISGYSRASVPIRFANEGLAGFIQKPFLPETLLERLRDLVEK